MDFYLNILLFLFPDKIAGIFIAGLDAIADKNDLTAPFAEIFERFTEAKGDRCFLDRIDASPKILELCNYSSWSSERNAEFGIKIIFGDRINFYTHIHFLPTVGGEDQDGQFHTLSFFSKSLLAKLFSRAVFSMLLHQGLINLQLVSKDHAQVSRRVQCAT